MADFEFTAQQQHAITLIQEWFADWQATKRKQVFFLTGQAGTGKTSLAKAAAEGCVSTPAQIEYIAPTGKAASRLRQKGCPARTLHQFAYNLRGEDEEGNPLFAAKNVLNVSPLLVVLDEGSMVGAPNFDAVLRHGLPVLVLGDLNQLPPVKAPAYLTPEHVDFELTEILRQNADSNIIRAATFAREGRRLPLREYEDVRVRDGYPTLDDLLEHTDEDGQILAARNDTRHKINRDVRKALGFAGDLPQVGEKLVALANQHQYGIMNGEQCILLAYEEIKSWEFDAGDNEKMMYAKVRMLTNNATKKVKFNPLAFSDDADTKAKAIKEIGAFDLGYCVTVHKAQGSEWKRIAFVEQMLRGGDAAKLRYTAYTRASERLSIWR